MQTVKYMAADRGTADFGWLKPNFYFSFGQYHNPAKVHFGMLRVLNDDYIAGGGMFPTHPHDNMEIITIPFTGALKHKDNTGGKGIIQAGDVQIMSAGTGVQHSEANASQTEAVTLFQIWIFPKQKNITPRYDQRTFNTTNRDNAWQTIVSPIAAHNALFINQNAVLSLTNLKAGNTINYTNSFIGNGVFFVVINGTAIINNNTLNKRDAIGIYDTEIFEIEATENTEILAIEVPMQ